jgi:glutathione S-transferase/GST-like protein
MITLYHWEPNADSLKFIVALKEKKLPFESRYVDLLELEHHGEAFRAIAGDARVPLIVEDGEPLKDSQFALQYLAEAFEPRLAPEDPAGWYDIQAWTAELEQVLRPNVRLLGWHLVTSPAMSEDQRQSFLARAERVPKPQVMAGWAQVTSDAEASEDQLANARERIGEVIARLEAQLLQTEWLVGGSYSIADINAFALVHTLPRLTSDIVSEERTPALLAWIERIRRRPAVAEALTMRRSPLGDDVYAPIV